MESCANKFVCTACLCVGRSLRNFTEEKYKDFYVKALSEIPLFILSSVNLEVCFDCEALLMRAVAFREQVKDSYRILQTYTKETLAECLLTDVSRPPRLKVHILESVNFTPNSDKEYDTRCQVDVDADVKREGLQVKYEDSESDSAIYDINGITSKSSAVSLLTDVSRPPRLKVHILESVNFTPNSDKENDSRREDVKREKKILVKDEDSDSDSTNFDSQAVSFTPNGDKDYDSLSEVAVDVKTENGSEEKLQYKYAVSDPDSANYENVPTKRKVVKKKLRSIAKKDSKRNKNNLNSDNKALKKGLQNGKKIKTVHNRKILEINIDAMDLTTEENDWREELNHTKDLKIIDVKKRKKLKQVNELVNNKKLKDKIKTIQLTNEEIYKERQFEYEEEYYLNSKYKCESCIKGFDDSKNFTSHNETKHDRSLGEFVCSICQTVLSSIATYTAHCNRHYKRYECNICSYRASDIKSTRQHLLTSHRIFKQYTCRLCKQTNISLDSHRTHMECHKSRVQCPDCDKTFSHRAGLLNHRLAVHESKNKFPCSLCDKVFQWKNSLKRHLEKHDAKNKSEDKGAFCSPCGISFAYVCSYKRHLRNSLKHVSHDQLKFTCDHCKRRFADKTKLRDHIEEKHLHKSYQCYICQKPSKNRGHLEQHIRNVHIGRPNNKMCHHCGKGFPTKVQLESHIRTHTGERPFICEFCPTTFTQQSNLYKHNRQVHQNIKMKKYPTHKRQKTEDFNTNSHKSNQNSRNYQQNSSRNNEDSEYTRQISVQQYGEQFTNFAFTMGIK